MATDLGKAYVQIVPSATGISGGIANAIQPGAKAAGTQAGTTIGRTMGERISAVGKSFIKTGAIATAISVPVIKGIKDALSAYEVQATAETKLTEIYKSRMGVGKQAAKQTMELASALQKEGVIGDEVALSGAQQLATYAKYPDTVNKLLPSMENLLAQQKGVNATTEDAVNIGNLMGKVMMGQTGALKRVGISFTEAQEKVLKYGTEEEKAAMLSEVINQNVGNMNKTLAKTPAGKMQQLQNTLGDIKEQLGAALAPVLSDLAEKVSTKVIPIIERLVKFILAHPVIAKIALAITGLLAVGGPLLIMLGTIMTILPVLGTAFGALAGPIGIVIAIITGLIAGGILLVKNWDKIKAAATALKKWVVQKFTELKTAALNKVKELKTNVLKLFNSIKTGIVNAFRAVGRTIKTIVSTWFKIVTWPFRQAWDFISNIADKIKNAFDFDFHLPHIKLPHFKIYPRGWQLGDLLHGSIPYLGIDWYAKGGIMTKPMVFAGGGDAGPEGIIPLNPFWEKMDRMIETIENGADQSGDVIMNVYGTPGMDVNQLALKVEQRLVSLQKQRNSVWA